VGAGMDLVYGAQKSFSGVLSGPAKHALQATRYQAHYKCVRLPSPFF